MFDLANDRLSYSELLRPDEKYTLDLAVGMTYSLDLEALLGIPLSLGLLDDPDPQAMANPLVILEAIRSSADRIALFCNAGGIKLPNKVQSVYSLLENSVFQVVCPSGGNFHPKLWALRYHNEDGDAYIKLLVLSRNLTSDASIDLCVSLRGKIGGRRRRKNAALSELLAYVSGFANDGKKEKILELAGEIRYVAAFEVEAPFEDYDFFPLGIPGHDGRATELFDDKRDLFVVSPFLSDDVVKKLTESPWRKVLVTRKASVTKKVTEAFDEVYITKEVLTDNEYQIRQDIHAKLYFTSTSAGNYLYIGSANASHNAFYKNVEVLLRLKYRPYYGGFQTIMNDFIPRENCPYERLESVPETVRAEEEQLIADRALREAVRTLLGAKAVSEGDTYRLVVSAGPRKEKEPVYLAPLQRRTMVLPLKEETVFRRLLLKELSAFFIPRVREEQVIVKLDTAGIPETRDDAIYRGIIDTKEKFLSYLSFVLSDSYAADAVELATEEQLSRPARVGQNAAAFTAVYEKMLRVFHREPGRLGGIADMIRRLDPEVVGEDFAQMYGQFEEAVRRRQDP